MVNIVFDFFYRLITVCLIGGCTAGNDLIIYTVIGQEFDNLADSVDVGLN